MHVGGHIHAAGEPELGNTAECDHDEPSGRPFDGQLRVADEGGQYSANNRRENACDCGVAARQ